MYVPMDVRVWMDGWMAEGQNEWADRRREKGKGKECREAKYTS
jgi:hypothetical protein